MATFPVRKCPHCESFFTGQSQTKHNERCVALHPELEDTHPKSADYWDRYDPSDPVESTPPDTIHDF